MSNSDYLHNKNVKLSQEFLWLCSLVHLLHVMTIMFFRAETFHYLAVEKTFQHQAGQPC